jgi:hypothetical protein
VLAELVEFEWGSGRKNARDINSFWVIAMEFSRSGGNETSFVASRSVFYYRCWCWTGCVYCYWGVKPSFTRYAGVDWFSTICLVNKGDVSLAQMLLLG